MSIQGTILHRFLLLFFTCLGIASGTRLPDTIRVRSHHLSRSTFRKDSGYTANSLAAWNSSYVSVGCKASFLRGLFWLTIVLVRNGRARAVELARANFLLRTKDFSIEVFAVSGF
jgi:hypothetical protein